MQLDFSTNTGRSTKARRSSAASILECTERRPGVMFPLSAVIPMTLPAIGSNFLTLLARLPRASAAVCAPLNHRSGDFRDFLNQ